MGLRHVPEGEFVYVSTWQALAGRKNVVFFDGYAAADTFAVAREPTAVLTGSCDCGPHYQGESHPNRDLQKHRDFVDWEGIARNKTRYAGVTLQPPCNMGSCDPSHRYSMKTDRWTWCTFADLPEWVTRWYCVNLNVDHPRMEWVPFGLNDQGPGSSYIAKKQTWDKPGLAYLNCQDYSMRRVELKKFFRQSWVTCRPESTLPVEEYLDEVAAHKFVLCPYGNGLDQYRVWETIYLGSVPVLEDCPFARHVERSGLPALVVKDMTDLSPPGLEKIWEEFRQMEWDYSKATHSYWEGRLG